MTEQLGTLYSFACPVCGRVRSLSPSASRAIVSGASSGECRPGVGCRTAIVRQEQFRRDWLTWAGVDELEIRRSGGALAYVAEHGLPGPLVDLAGIMPQNVTLVDRRKGTGRPTRGFLIVGSAA